MTTTTSSSGTGPSAPGVVSRDERDHGFWDGRWTLPSRSQLEALQTLGAPLPTELPGEPSEVQAAWDLEVSKWNQLTPSQRELWSKAADKGWNSTTRQNLSLKESAAARKSLAQRGELDRILTPRYILTDKADGIRAEACLLLRTHQLNLWSQGSRTGRT